MNKFLYVPCIYILAFTGVFYSCSEDEEVAKSTADFTYQVDEEDFLTIHFTNTSENYDFSYWRFDDNSGHSTENSPTHTYDNAGVYQVTLAVATDGGGHEIRKEVVIQDPALQGERVTSGSMDDPQAWTFYDAGYDVMTTYEFVDGTLKFSNIEPTTNIVVWQEIKVEAGREYQFSANVKGGGMSNAWMEFLLGSSKPEIGEDYADGKFASMNTWAECGVENFEGNVVEIGCDGDGIAANGIITFEEGGTKYLVFKAGSWEGTLGPKGVIVDNISLMPL